ncbi:hypothetical protein FPHOBKDP_00018 [Listeria phage LPJP1]|nr:hypothetical protein FPHOBKDP_00018 [Listeria phage LPJP1]
MPNIEDAISLRIIGDIKDLDDITDKELDFSRNCEVITSVTYDVLNKNDNNNEYMTLNIYGPKGVTDRIDNEVNSKIDILIESIQEAINLMESGDLELPLSTDFGPFEDNFIERLYAQFVKEFNTFYNFTSSEGSCNSDDKLETKPKVYTFSISFVVSNIMVNSPGVFNVLLHDKIQKIWYTQDIPTNKNYSEEEIIKLSINQYIDDFFGKIFSSSDVDKKISLLDNYEFIEGENTKFINLFHIVLKSESLNTELDMVIKVKDFSTEVISDDEKATIDKYNRDQKVYKELFIYKLLDQVNGKKS